MSHTAFVPTRALRFRSFPAVTALYAIVFAACLLLAPLKARADTLDSLLDILVTAGVVDGAVKDAKPLIQCLIGNNGNVSACVDVKSIAEQQGQQAVKKYAPTDPAIQSTLEIIRAAYASDWFKVLELTGTDLLVQIACKAGLSATGPVKNFICSGTFKQVSGLAKAEVKQVLVLVGNPTIGNLLALIEMNVSPDLACAVAPDFPGKSQICGSLGELVKLGQDVAKYAAKYGKDIWYGAGDVLGLNDPPAMSQEAYYALAWSPWYHRGIWLCLTKNCKGYGDGNNTNDLLSSIWHPCKDYFASHDMTESTAQSACDDMRSKFDKHVKAFVTALPAAADAYVGTMQPLAKAWVVDDYGSVALPQYKATYLQGCTNVVSTSFPFPAPNPSTQVPSPTAWEYVCNAAVPSFVAMVNAEQSSLQQQLSKLGAAGCREPNGWTAAQGIHLTCDNYAAYQSCLTGLSAGKKTHCQLDQYKADQNLAKDIAQKLGAKRCAVDGLNVRCSRPWKKKGCEDSLVAYTPKGTKVHCTEGPSMAIVAFTVQMKKAEQITFQLDKAGYPCNRPFPGAAFPGADWDPLIIGCKHMKSPPQLAQLGNTGNCLPDSRHDGADAPCLWMVPDTPPVTRRSIHDRVDPTGQLAINKLAVDSGNVTAAPASSRLGHAAGGAAGAKIGAAATLTAKPALAGSAALGGAGAPTKPMSGNLPPGFGPPMGGIGRQAPAKAAARVALAAPGLAIVAAQAKIEANCSSPLAALTVHVTIRNSGDPLAAGRSKVYVREIGGARLASAGIDVPAIGGGQVALPVRIPVSTSHPYATLAGNHRLEVILEPSTAGRRPEAGRTAGTPYELSVTFPDGHCRARPSPAQTLPARR